MKILSAILFSAFAAVLLTSAKAEARPEAEYGPWGPFWVFSPDWTCPEEQYYKNADFFRAVAFDLRDRVQVLLDCGADIDVRNTYGQTPLHWAMYLEDPWMTNFLIDRGADPSARSRDGLTAEVSAKINWYRKTSRTCADDEEVNPFNVRECRSKFSCPEGQTEIADEVCQCPPATPFKRSGVCEAVAVCGGGKTITNDNTCECPAEAPHYVNGKCLDKPYCPKNTPYLLENAGTYEVTECSECPPGYQRFVNVNNWLICQIPKECQAPEYALDARNKCAPTNVCPGPEAGEPRYSQCRTSLAIRTLDASQCPEGAENEACRAAVLEARVAEAVRTFDTSKCPEGAENEACGAAVLEARLTREFSASPASQIKGIERAISLGLTGAGVTIGVGEQGGPYWEDDCRNGHPFIFSVALPGYVVPLKRPDEDVPARYRNYEDGECDRGLVRTHSDLPSIRVVDNSRPPVSSRVRDFAHGHVIAVFGAMAAKKDGYGVVGLAPGADYAYAYSTYDWDESSGADIVNYSIGPPAEQNLPITSYATLDGDGATLTTATRENMLRNEIWGIPLSLTLRLEHVNTHAPADRRINVIGAGNKSYDELGVFSGMPLYFPELRGNNLAVVAIEGKGRGIASYSDRCGLAGASFCLAAPAWGFALVPDIDYEQFVTANGTSFAAPMVAGALALVKEYFNRMGGIGNDELVRRILETADKSGGYADESIYGAGVLDLGNALTPQGELQLFSGRSVSDSESHLLSASGLRTGPAFGDSIDEALEDSEIAAFDNLNAPFPVAAAGLIQSEWESDSLRDALLAFQFEKLSPPQTQWDFANGFGWWSLRGASRAGQPEIKSIFGADDAYANPYSALAGDGMSAGLEWDSLRVAMFGETPGQETLARGAVGSFSFAPLSETTENGGWIFHFGGVDELNGFLSSSGSGAFGDLRSRTAFVGADYVGEKINGWRIRLGGFAGDTSAENGEWFAGTESLRSDSFHLGVERENIFYSGDGLGLRLHQPLRASGSLKIRIPTGRTRYGDLTWREVSGKTSGRELSLEGLYRRSFDGGSWRVSAGAVSEPGHRADAKTIGRMLFAFEREF